MSDSYPACPECSSPFAYEDQGQLVCPECGHEWDPNAAYESDDQLIVKDANGNPLQEGDSVTLIKDLKVKGGGTEKVGTKFQVRSLVDGDHNIDCGKLMLKSEFVKKA